MLQIGGKHWVFALLQLQVPTVQQCTWGDTDLTG